MSQAVSNRTFKRDQNSVVEILHSSQQQPRGGGGGGGGTRCPLGLPETRTVSLPPRAYERAQGSLCWVVSESGRSRSLQCDSTFGAEPRRVD